MRQVFALITRWLLICCPCAAWAETSPLPLWESSYDTVLLERIAALVPQLAYYPALRYPNQQSEQLLASSSKGKVLVFGYGSLISRESAGRSVSAEAIATMRPAVAFGVKRLFNYKAARTDHWGPIQDPKERAMLNLVPTWSYLNWVNGVVMEVDAEDLANLVKRETGYDLVPLIIADWDDVMAQHGDPNIRIAYSFVAASELRNHIIYTSTKYYPVRGYLHAIQDGAMDFGMHFRRVWNATTYLADGITRLDDWDEVTFRDILCTKEPGE